MSEKNEAFAALAEWVLAVVKDRRLATPQELAILPQIVGILLMRDYGQM